MARLVMRSGYGAVALVLPCAAALLAPVRAAEPALPPASLPASSPAAKAPAAPVDDSALPDPTRPQPAERAADPARAAAATPPSAASMRTYTLQSVLIADERRSAVVNGRLVEVDSKVDDARVERIEPDAVVLRLGSERIRITMDGLRTMPAARPPASPATSAAASAATSAVAQPSTPPSNPTAKLAAGPVPVGTAAPHP